MIMKPEVRKVALAVHLTLSVGWIGAVAAYITLDISTIASNNPQALRSAYSGMDLIVRSIIVPLALGTLATGLIMSLGTKWGLFRHYWVLISLVMTTIATTVLLIETQTISHLAGVAARSRTPVNELRSLGNTLAHSVGGTVVLVVVLVLNIFKPQGMTRYGWRKQEEERVRRERVKVGAR
jgi:hypothetical protein